jgi:hypothetical protein
MVNVTGYAYPWDVNDDPGAAAHAAELGVDVVALAANYHAARLVTPLHPTRRSLDVPHSAMYAPIRHKAWQDRRLVPRAPTWLEKDDWFNDAARRLSAEGLSVLAWMPITHEDDLGAQHPDLAVRNAFDDIYPYALCPSSDEVRMYCRTLVEEVLHTTDSAGVVLEACGPFGIEHGSVHDKSEMAGLNETQSILLSVCFCVACLHALDGFGLDADALADAVRTALSGPVSSLGEALGEDVAAQLAQFRAGLSSTLRHELVQSARSVRPDATVTVHASVSPWATGSFSALGDSSDVAELKAVVANCWNATTAEQELEGMGKLLGDQSTLGAFVRADRVTGSPEEFVERFRRLGMSELHLYHLGLFNRESLEVARELVSACHAAGDAPAAYDR